MNLLLRLSLLPLRARQLTVILGMAVAGTTALLHADTTTYTSEADAQVRSGSYTGVNYGAQNGMAVSQTASTNAYESFIRFNMGSGINGTITDAKVRLYNTNYSTTAPVHTVSAVSVDTWGESTITWNNKPASGTSLGSWNPTAVGYRDINVTSLIQAENSSGNKLFSVRVAASAIDATIINYASRENINTSIRPQLIVTWTATSTPVTVTLSPTQDVQIRSGYGTYPSYSTGTTFQVWAPQFQGLLRFNLDGIPGTITNAVLNFRCLTASTIPHRLYLESNDAWNEVDVTWANWFSAIPASASTQVAEWTPANAAFAVNVTSSAQSRNFSPGRMMTLRMAASADGTSGVSYATREHTTVSYRPTLTVTYTPGTVPGSVFALRNQQEVKNAMFTAKPGNTFTLANGIYSSLKVSMANSGTSSQPITLKALNAGQAKLTAASYVALKGDYLILSGFVFDKCTGGTAVSFDGGSHGRITECAFFDCGVADSPFTHLIEDTNGASHNTFDHLYMTGNMGMGIGIRVHPWNQGNTNHLVERNWFHNITGAPGGNGRESVQLGQGGPYNDPVTGAAWDGANPPMDNLTWTTIQNNLFLSACGDPEITSLKAGENIVRYNTVRDCTNQTLCSRGGSHNRIDGNFIFNSRGIRAFGPNHIIINNYLDGTSEGIWLGGGGGGYSPATNVLLAHNTVINGWQKALMLGENWVSGGQAPTGRIFNNIFQVAKDKVPVNTWGSGMDLSGINWSNNIGWRPASSNGIGWGYAANLTASQMSLVNPLFSTTLISGLKRYDSTSPAYNAGTGSILTEVPQDIDGQNRVSPPDIGADEVPASGTGTITRAPLVGADVGPIWMAGNPGNVVRVP